MAHWSEGAVPLSVETHVIRDLQQIAPSISHETPEVILFHLKNRTLSAETQIRDELFCTLAKTCATLPQESVVCILTTSAQAAQLLPLLESHLKFQLWIAVKSSALASETPVGQLPESHTALLVLTRCRSALRHTKTRLAYTYCPACGKTTKDYGGKKHVYHEYGTLMSDIWRDMDCNLYGEISPVVGRLRDMFGLAPYRSLRVLEIEVGQKPSRIPHAPTVRESRLPIEWETPISSGKSQLINDDCLTALARVPSESVDFCFADPPYNIQKQYDHWNDALESQEYFAWCDRWLSELARIVKPGRTVAVLNIPLWAVRHFQHLATLLQFQSWIAWEALGFPVRRIMPAHYAILCFSKGQSRPLPGIVSSSVRPIEQTALSPRAEAYCLRTACLKSRNRLRVTDAGELADLWSDIHRLKHNSRRVDHPCQLPPQLMRRLYALFTLSGETILDCFNGAGTSTLAAAQMQRKYIGIELSPQYHQLAAERHAQLAFGADPFAKQKGTTPNAKNSRVERLPKQQYVVSKKTLQLDVRRIAQELGHLPSREEVTTFSSYPLEYFDRYFFSWGEVCAAARTTGMSELPQKTLLAANTSPSLFDAEDEVPL